MKLRRLIPAFALAAASFMGCKGEYDPVSRVDRDAERAFEYYQYIPLEKLEETIAPDRKYVERTYIVVRKSDPDGQKFKVGFFDNLDKTWCKIGNIEYYPAPTAPAAPLSPNQ